MYIYIYIYLQEKFLKFIYSIQRRVHNITLIIRQVHTNNTDSAHYCCTRTYTYGASACVHDKHVICANTPLLHVTIPPMHIHNVYINIYIRH